MLQAVEEVMSEMPMLKRTEGKMVYELRPSADWDKGKAVAWLLEQIKKEYDEEVASLTPTSLNKKLWIRAQSKPWRKKALPLSLSRARIQSFLFRDVGVSDATSSSYSLTSSSSSLRSSSLFCLRSLPLNVSRVFLSSSSRPLSRNVSDGRRTSSRSKRPLPGGP